MKFAEVYLNQTNKRIDHSYDYKIPEELVSTVLPGVRVSVNFGKGKRQLEAFVIRVKDTTPHLEKIKELDTVIDKSPILTTEQIALCLWMKDYYCSLFYEGLCNFTNPIKITRRLVASPFNPFESKWLFVPYESTEDVYRLVEDKAVRGPVQKQLMAFLKQRDFTQKELRELLGNIGGSLRTLEKKRLVEKYTRDLGTMDSVQKTPSHQGSLLELTAEEKALYEDFVEKQPQGLPIFMMEKRIKTKIKVYAQMIASCLKEKKTALVLFPEIHLSIETKELFYSYFGDQVAICHGKLTPKERYQIYKGVAHGVIKVLMGSRAALFMPMQNLGLIIVDEERDASYYAVAMPRYNAVDVAEKYAAFTKAQLVMSDEVPSVNAIKRIKEGSLNLIKSPIPNKEKTCVPEIVNLQTEIKQGNFDFMGRLVKTYLEETLEASKTALFLINKRGYASYVFCRNCGYVEKCPDCGVSLKYYTKGEVLKCHYCGYTKQRTTVCPSCGEKKIKALGLGIDQVYELLKKRYPDYRILKLDSDVVESYEKFKAINQGLQQKQWDIVLGTRILLRNFHLEHVGLSVALLIDSDLNHNDYGSSENAYQLYQRFFERAPQASLGVIQTYEPDHPVVEALASESSELFYEQELEYRGLMGYPPQKHLVLFSLFHENEASVRQDSQQFYGALKREIAEYTEKGMLEVFEPFLSGLIRGSKQIRWKIMLKVTDLNLFQKLIQKMMAAGEIECLDSKTSIEIDPPSTL